MEGVWVMAAWGGSSPMLARRRLAAALRGLREERGHTLEQVAEELLVSVSKLSRLEKGQGLPQIRDVRDLINYYDVAGTDLAENLKRWAADGRKKGWWQPYQSAFNLEDDEYIAYETDATVNLAFTVPYMHGLLQTEAYSRAMLLAMGHASSSEEAAQLASTREIRRANLRDRGDREPLELRVVLHEICLSPGFKDPEVGRGQLEHLLDVSKWDNVDIRVLLAGTEPHRAAIGMWQHLSFGEDIDRDVVILESPSGFTYIDEERRTRLYERWFNELSRRSLNPERTRDHIRTLLTDAGNTLPRG